MTISNELVSVLSFLLPGFIVAWVFHGLTPFPKPSELERVVQALIFTMMVRAGVTSLEAVVRLCWPTPWDSDATLVASVVLALLLGLLFARWATHDTLHSRLRKLRFTSITSYPSEWFSDFSRNQTYVVLHLDGGRRLYGWPEQWPLAPDAGQFSISEAEWLDDDKRIPLEGVKNILVLSEDVEMVEFMEPLSSSTVGERNGDEEA